MRVRSKRTASYSVQLIDCMMPPSIWLRMPSGLTASPLSTAATTRVTRARRRSRARPRPRIAIAAVGREILVAGEGEAAAASASPALYAAQPNRSAASRDHVACARVVEMPQAELDGIGARAATRQLVHEALDREHVHVGAERAQRRDAQRHVRHEVMDDPRVRQLVQRDRVAVAAAVGLRIGLGGGGANGVRQLPRGRADRRRAPGRVECVLLQTSYCQSTMLPVGVERSAAPSSPSPGRTAPTHAPARASTARAPDVPEARARAAPRRPPHRRRRCGRSSPSPPCGCSARCRPAARASRRSRRAAERRPACASTPCSAPSSNMRRPRRKGRSSHASDRAAVGRLDAVRRRRGAGRAASTITVSCDRQALQQSCRCRLAPAASPSRPSSPPAQARASPDRLALAFGDRPRGSCRRARSSARPASPRPRACRRSSDVAP